MKVDWASMTAAEVLDALESSPVVLSPWKKWSFGQGWSRHEFNPPGRVLYGAHHIAVQPSTPGPGWLISGFTGFTGPVVVAPDETTAKARADERASVLGWKLLDE